MILTIILFLLAGIAEIGGGYLVWLWAREAKPVSFGIAGASSSSLMGSFLPSSSSRLSDGFMRHMAVCLWFLLCFGAGGSIEKRLICTIG